MTEDDEGRDFDEVNGLYCGLYFTDGAEDPFCPSNIGISGLPWMSKSMEGTLLNKPIASFTAAVNICQIACSFSNLISVFTGWIFTSISDGDTSK